MDASQTDVAAGGEPGLIDLVVACVDPAALPSFHAVLVRRRPDGLRTPILLVPQELRRETVDELCQNGVADFILPPIRGEEVAARLRHQAARLQEKRTLAERLRGNLGPRLIVGESAAIRGLVSQLPRIARCKAPVLITGESGTGKEVFARAIHYLDSRADRPFIPVNCGALPETLIESELFGLKRGSFTGAVADRPGLIDEADGGTLFLDEVDSLPKTAQVKLLRFLQEGEYRAVGSSTTLQADVRIIAAASGAILRLLAEGAFREDLFFRLNVMRVPLPALRERRADIGLLANHFLQKQALLAGEPPRRLSESALRRLEEHHWPGNVRELENVIARAHFLSDGAVIEAESLDLPASVSMTDDSFSTQKAQLIRRFEHDYLQRLLREHGGNISQAARAAKKNRRSFWELLRKHKLLAPSE